MTAAEITGGGSSCRRMTPGAVNPGLRPLMELIARSASRQLRERAEVQAREETAGTPPASDASQEAGEGSAIGTTDRWPA